jgi:hypothetical protein
MPSEPNAEHDKRVRFEDRLVEVAQSGLEGEVPDRASLEYVRPHLNQFDPRCDFAALLRFARIVDGRGRNLTTYVENNWPFLFGGLDEHSLRGARSAIRALDACCKRQRVPPVIEAISPHHAQSFMRSMAASGLAHRTLENRRAVYAKIWDRVIAEEEGFIADSPAVRLHPASRPMLNPWREPETHPRRFAEAKARSPRSDRGVTRYCPEESEAARRTPAVAKLRACVAARTALTRKADLAAHSLRVVLRGLEARGTVSNHGIARQLNERAIRTSRGAQWDHKAVRRLKARLNWRTK